MRPRPFFSKIVDGAASCRVLVVLRRSYWRLHAYTDVGIADVVSSSMLNVAPGI